MVPPKYWRMLGEKPTESPKGLKSRVDVHSGVGERPRTEVPNAPCRPTLAVRAQNEIGRRAAGCAFVGAEVRFEREAGAQAAAQVVAAADAEVARRHAAAFGTFHRRAARTLEAADRHVDQAVHGLYELRRHARARSTGECRNRGLGNKSVHGQIDGGMIDSVAAPSAPVRIGSDSTAGGPRTLPRRHSLGDAPTADAVSPARHHFNARPGWAPTGHGGQESCAGARARSAWSGSRSCRRLSAYVALATSARPPSARRPATRSG